MTELRQQSPAAALIELGAGADVIERFVREAFDQVEPYTVGAEEELLLLDADTLELAPVGERVLAAVGGDARLVPEFRAAQLEIVTPVCTSVPDVARELKSARRVLSLALEEGVVAIAAGTSPVAFGGGRVTDGARYRWIAEECPWAAQHALTCGLHVHVAVPGAERALAVHNALRGYLPELTALAANAPYFGGFDSQLATVRPMLNRAFPRFGVPPALRSLREYAQFVAWGRDSGTVPDPSYHWWDLRLHPGTGTIELRVADAQTRVEDAAAVLALVQSLVVWLAERVDAGDRLPVHPSEKILENAWLAARDGVEAKLPDYFSGKRTHAGERLLELEELLAPTARARGCDAELNGLVQLVLAGGGAERQRQLAQHEGVAALVAYLAKETLEQPPPLVALASDR